MKIKIVLTLLVIFTITSCKKPYPNDIPSWLKKRIDQCKNGKCCNTGIANVVEYTNSSNQEKLFMIKGHNSMASLNYYDYDGNLVCVYSAGCCYNDSCGRIPINKMVYSRSIWNVDSKKCN